MNDIPLHDIKPLVAVPDNSLMILVVVVSLVLTAVLVPLFIWLYKLYKKNQKVNKRKEYLEKIHNIDISDAKTAAYEISKYGLLLAESERELEMLESLDKRLSVYKYKKEVESLDEETLGYYQLFLEVVDAS